MTNDKSDLLPIGKIVGVHGIKGILKVISFSESPFIFKPGDSILLKGNDGRDIFHEVEWIKPHKRVFLMCLKDITDCNMAEALIGEEFFIEKEILPELEEGTYYWVDLIGLSVYTTDDICIGRIESIIQTGSNDVYVVKDKDKETLIPALESVILSVNLEEKIMRVDLPEEL